MTATALCEKIVSQMGGETHLKSLGARVSVNDETHVSVRLSQPNPRGVRSIIITTRLNGLVDMDFFGPLRPNSFSAPRVDHVDNIREENLAETLGKFTGDERLHGQRSNV